MNYTAKRYNDLVVINERLTYNLKAKLDELDEQKANFESLEAMKNATTEEGLRIEALQKELDAVEQEIDERTHYTRQLDHVLMRLKRNALKFDAHMAGMEEAMNALDKEGNEVRLLRRALDAGLAKAVAVYDETQTNLAAARKDREVLIAQRRSEVKNAQMLKEWLAEREMQKAKLALELRGDLTSTEEHFLKGQISDKTEKSKKLQKANEDSTRQLQAMEEAFSQIKLVTAANSVEEIEEKFTNQRLAKKNLEQEVKDLEPKLARAKKTLKAKEALFQELKSSGGNVADLTRDVTDKIEEQINSCKVDGKLVTAQTIRLESVLLGIEQGSMGLLLRIKPYLHLAEGGVFDLTQTQEPDRVSETIEALSSAEQVLAKMLEIIAGNADGGSPVLKSSPKADFDNDDYSAASDGKSSTSDMVPPDRVNIRIRSKQRQKEQEWASMHEGERQMQSIGQPDLSGGLDDDGSMALQAAEKSTHHQRDQAKVVEEQVFTRQLVKKKAEKEDQERRRADEMDARKKKLAERMASGSSSSKKAAAPAEDEDGKAAAPAVDPELILANYARLKKQRAMANRLCTIQAPITLPEGVSLRDDIMTKSTAFLTKMPKLV